MTTLTIDDIREMVKNGTLREHHTALARGYISRKSAGVVGKYSGKFGDGYTISYPRHDTTQYHTVVYYIKN